MHELIVILGSLSLIGVVFYLGWNLTKDEPQSKIPH